MICQISSQLSVKSVVRIMTYTTIQQAFRPLFFTCFIIGLCIYPLNKPTTREKWVLYLSILYSVTLWSIYGYIFYCMVSSLSLAGIFPATISIVVLENNIIITMTSTIFNLYYNKRLQMCIKKLSIVDDTLKELGSLKMYQKIHMWSRRVIAGWVVCSFGLNFHDTLSWQKYLTIIRKETTFWRFIIAHIYNYSFHINALVDLVFMFFLWYIGTRFDEINKHIRNLLIKKEHWLKNTWKKPPVTVHQYTLDIDNYKRVLWSLMHLYLELCRIAREWNMIFRMQMTFEMVSYPLTVTSICYYLYKLLMNKYGLFIPTIVWCRVVSWLFVFVGKFYIINYICENVSVKAYTIEKTINELTNILRYADVWKEIYQFTLHARQYPLKFTGMGLFNFGNKFLIKFCITISTYVIIMIQMSDG
ncbi:putative gustatory receptor 28b [Monomorium pharaonis]|uniref:putative gustatory receptor 28b n=1 Tax=Monomorium pharaonis TaxID=307658 RepID=UPI0017465517|nr:putative gustatory receptor 28b [Monomorium pharaonis]